MRSSRSSYVGEAHVTQGRTATSNIRRCLAFILAFGMIVALGLGTAETLPNRDIRQFVNGLGIGDTSQLGAGLKRIGLQSAYADETDCDANKDGDCDAKGNEQFDKFKGSSMKDAGFEETSELQQTGKDDVNSNWMGAMDLADKNDNYDENGENGIKKSTKLSDVFSMVLKRLMPGYYLKNIQPTEDDVYAWKDWECGDQDSAPTLENANCDVPNITTEGVQNLVALFDDHGIQNYKMRKAQTPFGLGFAKELLPTDEVPINLKDAQYKYTALEAFGYNLAWTKYNGEWDHIQVLTNMRLKSSMGLGGGLKTLGQTVGDTVAGFVQGTSDGFKSAVSDVGNDIQNGNWIKAPFDAVAIPFKALWNGFKTAVASGLYRLLNNLMNGFEYTSVQNKAWYRPNFVSETVYGLTSLTEVEKNAVINKRIEDAAVEGVKKALDEMPEELTEDAIRAKYMVPYSPWVQYNPKKEQSWDDWKKENIVKLIGAKDLGVDMTKYESGQFQNQSPTERYEAFSKDWKAGVDNKVQTSKEEYLQQVKSLINFKVNTQIKQDVYKDYGSRPASAWMFCSEGKPEDPGVKSAMDAGRIRKVGKEAYKYTWDDMGRMTSATYQCATPVRPTIVGGLLGSSRKNTDGKIDTRRSAYNMGERLMDIYVKGTPWRLIDFDAFGSSMLFISQRITMIMNTLIGWSFEPILEKFGIKTILMDWTKKLRDTIYIEFIVMAIAIAGLMVIWKLIRGNPVESFKQIAAIILTVGLGIMLLFNTSMMFKLVDDVPTALERAVMGTVLSAGGTDKICTATGSPKHTVSASATFESMFGDNKDFNPDSQVRVMQCKIWTAFVFTPWTYGQFGVGWNELWANGHKLDGGAGAAELATSDGVNKLVGNAGVNLGKQITVNNWALYQVAHTTSGTITTQDMNRRPGENDKAMYRLVDAQAGPENGMGRDATHFDTWSSNTPSRVLIGAMSIFTATVGLLGIGGLAIKKIQYTITATLMLLLSPIVMLLGVIPGKNRLRLKQYGWETLSLCLKRICMVLIMCVGLEAMVEIGMASTGSWFSTLFAIAIVALVIKFYGKELADKLTSTVNSKAGQWKSANDVVRNAVSNNAFLTSLSDSAKSGFTAVAGGVIGGMMAHNLNGSMKSARKEFTRDFIRSMGPGTRNAAAIGDFKSFVGKVAAGGGSASLMNAINSGAKLSKNQLAELAKIDERTGTHLLRDYKTNQGKYQLGSNLELARQMIMRERQGLDFETGAHLTLGERRKRREEMWDRLQQMGVATALGYAPRVSGTSIMRQELKLINQRMYRARLAQGKTSVIWEHMKKQHNKRGKDPLMNDKKTILSMMNEAGFDSEGVISRVNHAMFNGVNMGAKTSVEDSRFALHKGEEAQMLTRENLKMLIMSAKDPRKLRHDIEIAMSEGGAAWDKVAADLMDGNVIDKTSAAYKMAWGIDPNNDVVRNYDKAGVTAKFQSGDAEMVRDVNKAREQVAKMHGVSASSITDDQAIDYLVGERMRSGDAAFEMANDSMRNNEKTRALKREQEDAMDIIMAGTVYDDGNGGTMTREQAKNASPARRAQQEEDRKAMIEAVKPRYELEAAENAKVEKIDRKIEELKDGLADGSINGMNAINAKDEIRRLETEKRVHSRNAESYHRNAVAAQDEYKQKYEPIAVSDSNWQTTAQDNIDATMAAMNSALAVDPSLNSDPSRIDSFPMIDARTGDPLRDSSGRTITFKNYRESIAKVSAINETISVNNSTASMYNLQAQTAGSWNSMSSEDRKIAIAQADKLAKSQDSSMRCTGFDTSTGKFKFSKSTSKASDTTSFTGGSLGIFGDGTRSDISSNLNQYQWEKVHGNNDPTTSEKLEKTEQRRKEAKANVAATGGSSLVEAQIQNLDGHGGAVFMDAEARRNTMNATMNFNILNAAASNNAVDAARRMTAGLLDFAQKHHTENYDNRTLKETGVTLDEMDSHVYTPRPR